jgi:hypothetical protein
MDEEEFLRLIHREYTKIIKIKDEFNVHPSFNYKFKKYLLYHNINIASLKIDKNILVKLFASLSLKNYDVFIATILDLSYEIRIDYILIFKPIIRGLIDFCAKSKIHNINEGHLSTK